MSARVRELLDDSDKKWRVEITDGRVFEGRCVCLDRDLNLLVDGAFEFCKGMICNIISVHQRYHLFIAAKKRMVGMIMIPGKHLVSVKLIESIY